MYTTTRHILLRSGTTIGIATLMAMGCTIEPPGTTDDVDSSSTVDDKFGQTYASIADVLGIALQDYDSEFMTDFWPLAPLYDEDE